MATTLGDHHAGTVRIEEPQFEQLVGLLTPIAEAASLFLAEYRAGRGLEPPRDRDGEPKMDPEGHDPHPYHDIE